MSKPQFSVDELLPTYDEAYETLARMYERMIFDDMERVPVARFNGIERKTKTGCVLRVING